jgi:WD40 repeat protein
VRTFAEDQIKDRGYSTIAGVALSPDGKTVAAPASGKFDGEDGFSWLVLWDAETGKIRHKLKHPFFEVRALAFSRDSKMVATGTGINGAEQDFEAVKLWDVQTGKVVRTLQTRKWAVKVAFAPDSKLLAAVLTPDVAPDEVVIWNPAEGKSQTLPDSEGIEGVAFSPDGKVLLGASRTKLRRWDATTGKIIEGPDLKTDFSDEGWSAYAFSPDGKTVAISGKQGDKHLIAVYDVTSAKRVKTLEGCKGAITSLSFTPESNSLAAASIDEASYVQAILLWDFAPATKSKK